ncbi:MAG TPA: GH1 family beta-glucosidase [Polyangia bacterium]|nr:GH1 family beta-glucosidase [Polyangia bacterium]
MSKRVAGGVSRRKFLGVSAVSVAAATAAKAANKGSKKETLKDAGKGGDLFPKDFVWGAATASYQIEGAANEDGKGQSIWDVFCKKKGSVFEGHTGDVACDHYHRYKGDLALLKQLGARSYRFSVAWPRILPSGAGAVNDKGLDFYDRLVDEILLNGVEPLCTAFHWDYPQALYERGGWLNRDSADWFADYVAIIADRLGDRVKTWATQNEPQCYIGLALLEGVHAPGDKLKFPEYLLAAHNSMRAHGKAVQALRAHVKGAKVGYVLAAQITQPAGDGAGDLEAARQAIFAVDNRGEWCNAWWTDPVVFGRYPEDGLTYYGKDMPKIKASDLDEMKQPLDYLGLNIYKAESYRMGKGGKPEHVPFPPGYPRSGVDWQPITPGALYWGPRFFWERYKLPITITENGLSTRDQVFLDGKVHDPQRVDYMHRVLLELARAIKDGVPVRGYYAWSLLDNFEWADGYKQRFGMVYVDYANQKRIPKDSFEWYRKIIATNGRGLLDRGPVPVTQVTA